MEERSSFSTSFGMIAAAIGSAVGLANIWRFPYMVGVYGGGAFIVVYLAMVLLLGIGCVVVELVIGRRGQADAVQSFKNMAPGKKWHISGYLGVLASFLIMCYYPVVGGWMLEYIVKSATGAFIDQSPEQLTNMFYTLTSSPVKPVIWAIIYMAITMFIVMAGVENGIEKFTSISIPLLIILIIALDIKALTLDGAFEGVKYLFKPDWSLISFDTIFVALGHAFFSVGVGLAILTTYGSYMGQDENILKSTFIIVGADTGIALLAGLAIFPAVFAYGLEPTEGEGLVFITIPTVLAHMKGGTLFGLAFFGLLAIAGISSSIALVEPSVAWLVESKGWTRKKASLVVGVALMFFSALASLSLQPNSSLVFGGRTLFDLFDYVTANYLLSLAAFIEVVFIAWFYNREDFYDELTNGGTLQARGKGFLYNVLLKFVIPVSIAMIFISSFI